MSVLTIPTAEVFEPLLRPSRYKGAYGGRGSAKSHFFAGLLIEELVRDPTKRAVCVREVQKSLKDSAKLLLEDKIRQHGLGEHFNILNDRIETTKGGVILFQGMQDHTAESIKSLEGMSYAWCEEASTISAKSLELLRPTIRAPGSEIWFSWNPRLAADPVDRLLRNEETPPDAVVVKATYKDNPWFPKELEAERLFDKRHKPDRYGHIWLGDYEPQAVGAIFTLADVDEHRVTEAPRDFARIVVAVDPAVSSDEMADEHGIVVCGISDAGHGYVLEDATTKGSPRAWASRAIAMYDLHGADSIIVEKNQGGEMCKAVMDGVRTGLPVELVHATRGKHVRAEPISALYQTGRIHHVGHFPQLEAQLFQITAAGYEGEGSPDRADALVWAFTSLFNKLIRPPVEHQTRQAVAMNYDPMAYDRDQYARQAVAYD